MLYFKIILQITFNQQIIIFKPLLTVKHTKTLLNKKLFSFPLFDEFKYFYTNIHNFNT